ncbi:MAG: hypothetical protein JWQ66_3388 [Mucilaginibacter sp.]|nr:hypothetical protein [Mucilaginibacter sp.]
MHYQIITIHEKDKWTDFVNRCLVFDFYHTWQYHSGEHAGEAVLFVYTEDDMFVALPLIKRKIENSDMFDFTSIYGYAGPIANVSFNGLEDAFLSNFKASFLSYMKSEKIICLFSRLHPLIDQSPLINKFGGCVNNGKTVFIDLANSIEDQRSSYRKGHLDNINALRGKNISFKEAVSDEDIATFVQIYTENMMRIKATAGYFFDEEYFRNLVNSTEFKGQLLILYLDDNPISGGVFTYCNNIIQVHLLATRTDFLHDSPTKTLIDEVSILGRQLGMKYLHIGGGVGGKNDSLFYWKSGFSSTYLTFQTWRIITDLVAYNQLAYDHITQKISTKSQNDFFPLYRIAL